MNEPIKRQTAVILYEKDDGSFSIDISLSHNPNQAHVEVPALDVLTIALANLAVKADPAIAEAITRIQDAYDALTLNPSAEDGVKQFNDTVGVQIYNVASVENNAS